MNLNNEQITAIRNRKRNQLILAAAGTGKTTVMGEIVEHLCSDDGVKEEDILCVTFTNKAKAEMQDRITKKNVDIRTMHSLYLKLVRMFSEKLGYSTDDVVMLSQVQAMEIAERVAVSYNAPMVSRNHIWRLVESVFRKMSGANSWPHAVVLALADRKVKAYCGCTTNENWCRWVQERGATFINGYVNTLVRDGVLDFGLAEVFAVALSRAMDVVKTLSHIKNVLVDEVQDMSRTQIDILVGLMPNAKFSCFGDFNQTIYGWRDSDPKYVRSVIEGKLQAVQTTLLHNYRSNPSIQYYGQAMLDVLNETQVTKYMNKPEAKLRVELAGRDCVDKIWEIANKWHHEHPTERIAVLSRNKSAHDVIKTGKILSEMEKSQDIREGSVDIRDLPGVEWTTVGGSNEEDVFEVDSNERGEPSRDVQFIYTTEFEMNDRRNVKMLDLACALAAHPMSEYTLKSWLSSFNIRQDVDMHDFLVLSTGNYKWDPRKDYYEDLLQSMADQNLWVFDLETTGKQTWQARIVQLCAKNPMTKEVFDLKVNPDVPVGESANVHGFTDAYLAEHGGKRIDVVKLAKEKFDGAVLCGHNVFYDIAVLNEELSREGLEPIKPIAVYDTLIEARRFFPNAPNHKLDTIRELMGVKNPATHNALQDVEATAAVLARLIARHILPNRATLKERLEKTWLSNGYVIQSLLSVTQKALDGEYEGILKWADGSNGDSLDREIRLGNEIRYVKGIELTAKSKYARAAEMHEFLNYKRGDIEALAQSADKVPVITIHQSKGCEFDRVIIFDHNKQLGYKGGVIKDLDAEEARVWYVSLTRAKKDVVVVSNAMSVEDMSIYLKILPEDILECVDYKIGLED